MQKALLMKLDFKIAKEKRKTKIIITVLWKGSLLSFVAYVKASAAKQTLLAQKHFFIAFVCLQLFAPLAAL